MNIVMTILLRIKFNLVNKKRRKKKIIYKNLMNFSFLNLYNNKYFNTFNDYQKNKIEFMVKILRDN